jgi:quinoprotein glucose dehydrogenase
MKFFTFVVCVICVASAAPAIPPTTAAVKNPATRYIERTAKRQAKQKAAEAEPNKPTTQALLNPNKPPAFAEAVKAMDGINLATGLKLSVFAAEPQLQHPVALWIDEKSRFWVVETFRFDGGGFGNGVYDIRNRYHLLDEDLASKTVEQRLATIKKWNKDDLSGLAQWPDRLKLIQDKDGDGRADAACVFAEWHEPLDGVAAGVITRGDDVYVANIPNLYLLKDKDKDGVSDSSQILSTGYGVRYSLLGHDLHGLRWGPDGRLYFSMGDRGAHVKTKEGTVIDLPDEGCVLRCEPDGSKLEVFARGLRNPQKLVFDQYGNLFTGDNNCDYGDPARWVYVVEGGDSGWRIGYQHLQTPRPTGPWLAEKLYMPLPDNTAAYINPPIANIASGPSGCTYNPGVTALPDRYAEHFFLTDFRAGPASVMHSFAMKPKGAGFELVDPGELIKGMSVTDIEFAPDGAAYVTDWVGSWEKQGRGRIYRISAPELDKDPKVAQTKKLISEGAAACGFADLVARLAHPDMRVRQAAQFELASRGTQSVPHLTEALQSDSRSTKIHALWAFGQIVRATSDKTILRPALALLSDKDDEVRAQAVRVLGEAQFEDAFATILKLCADDSPRVRYFATLNAGRYHKSAALPAIVQVLESDKNKDVYLRHAASLALSMLTDRMTAGIADRRSPAVRMGVVLALRRQKSAALARFLQDETMSIVIEAARAINDEQIEDAQPALAKLVENVALPEPVLLRALHANFRIGGTDNAATVANFAARADAPEVLRVEALAMLKEWDNPRGIDRVTGIWRPLP